MDSLLIYSDNQCCMLPANIDLLWGLRLLPYSVKHRVAGFLYGLHHETCYTVKGVVWNWEVKRESDVVTY